MHYLKACVLTIIVFLFLPFAAAANEPLVHRVEAGESLFSVAQKYHISMDELLKENSYIRFPELIYPNQLLVIPEFSKSDALSGLPPTINTTGETKPQSSINQPSRTYSNHFHLSSPPAGNMVALTFDDGPDGVYTGMVLDVLKAYDVPATFFLIGQNVQKYPEVVQRIVGEGHVIGNHTWSHPRLTEIAANEIADQIVKTEDMLEAVTNLRTRLMRPPYGAVNLDTLEQLIELDYSIINWSVDSVDWRDQDVDLILINTLPHVRDGAIMLFHTARGIGHNPTATAYALPELIETLRKQGYNFVTVDKLLNIPPYR